MQASYDDVIEAIITTVLKKFVNTSFNIGY